MIIVIEKGLILNRVSTGCWSALCLVMGFVLPQLILTLVKFLIFGNHGLSGVAR
jgi:hypothetical protein